MQNTSSNKIDGTATKQDLPPGCLRLFGLPFFIAGLIMLGWGGDMLLTWHKSGEWPKVRAKILSAEMQSHRGSKGGTTYSVAGSFEYAYEEKNYKSNRISLDNGSSSNYGEHEEILAILQEAMRNRQTLEAFVNPADPDKAFLFRRISMGMIIVAGVGVLFFSMGLLMLLGVFSASNKGVDQKKLQQNPDQPWLADPRWNGFSLKTRNLKSLYSLYAIAAFFSIFISIFVIVMYLDSSTPFFAWFFISIFVLVTLLLDITAIYKTLQYLKFRESTLLLGQFPISTGCEFVAVLAVLPRFTAGQKMEFKLLCEKKLVTGSGKQSNTSIDVLYTSSHSIEIRPENFSRNLIFVPVKLRIPQKAIESTPEDLNPSITWKLQASASIPGVDYAAEFPLPVYLVENSALIQFKQ